MFFVRFSIYRALPHGGQPWHPGMSRQGIRYDILRKGGSRCPAFLKFARGKLTISWPGSNPRAIREESTAQLFIRLSIEISSNGVFSARIRPCGSNHAKILSVKRRSAKIARPLVLSVFACCRNKSLYLVSISRIELAH